MVDDCGQPMIVLGLTGSIGMGKSTAAAAFRRLGVPVFDADRGVRRTLEDGGAAVPAIAAAFPGMVKAGAVERAALAGLVFEDAAARRKLVSIVHPLVRAQELRFLARARIERRKIAVLDIPLLFETGADRLCDATVVVTAPRFVQAQRVLSRPGMTKAMFARILASQMPDIEKRRRADFSAPTGLGQRATLKALRRIVRLVNKKSGAPSRVSNAKRYARNRPRY